MLYLIHTDHDGGLPVGGAGEGDGLLLLGGVAVAHGLLQPLAQLSVQGSVVRVLHCFQGQSAAVHIWRHHEQHF